MSIHLLRSRPSRSTLFIRLLTGGIFLAEGLQKWYAPNAYVYDATVYGFFDQFVGASYAVCGAFIMAGFLTRLVVTPLLIIVISAVAVFKAEVYVNSGFWVLLHESMIDWAMFWGCIFLLAKGSGKWAVDCLFIKAEAA